MFPKDDKNEIAWLFGSFWRRDLNPFIWPHEVLRHYSVTLPCLGWPKESNVKTTSINISQHTSQITNNFHFLKAREFYFPMDADSIVWVFLTAKLNQVGTSRAPSPPPMITVTSHTTLGISTTQTTKKKPPYQVFEHRQLKQTQTRPATCTAVNKARWGMSLHSSEQILSVSHWLVEILAFRWILMSEAAWIQTE